MPRKKPIAAAELKQEMEKVQAATVYLPFRPSESLMMIKCNFWAHAKDLVLDDSDVTPALVEQCLPRAEASIVLERWESDEAFVRWFTNSRMHVARIEYLFSKALNALEEIVDNNDPRNSLARCNAARQLGELAGKFISRGSQRGDGVPDSTRKAIAAMGQDDLLKFLQKNTADLRLPAASGTLPVEEESAHEEEQLTPST